MGIKEFVNPCWLLMVEVELLYILMQYVFDVIIVHDIIIFFCFFFFVYKCSFIATIRTCHYTDLEVHTPWQGGVPVIATFKYLHIKIQEIYTKPQKVEYILQNFHKINFK